MMSLYICHIVLKFSSSGKNIIFYSWGRNSENNKQKITTLSRAKIQVYVLLLMRSKMSIRTFPEARFRFRNLWSSANYLFNFVTDASVRIQSPLFCSNISCFLFYPQLFLVQYIKCSPSCSRAIRPNGLTPTWAAGFCSLYIQAWMHTYTYT